MRVKVTKMAFYNGGRVRPGDVINVPDGTKAKWFEPVAEKVEKPAAAPVKPKGKAPAKEPEPSGEVEGEDANGLI